MFGFYGSPNKYLYRNHKVIEIIQGLGFGENNSHKMGNFSKYVQVVINTKTNGGKILLSLNKGFFSLLQPQAQLSWHPS